VQREKEPHSKARAQDLHPFVEEGAEEIDCLLNVRVGGQALALRLRLGVRIGQGDLVLRREGQVRAVRVGCLR